MIVFDLEGDGLVPTKIYVVSARVDGKIVSYTNYDDMRKFFLEHDTFIGHNITRFDIPVIERILGIKVKARLIDTLAISWYLYPKRLIHGLDSWGNDLGVEKPKIDDWENLPLEEYIKRCEEDVKINNRLWNKMKVDLLKLYGDKKEADRLIKYLQFKMHCARLQEDSKWKVSVDNVEQHAATLTKEKADKMPDLIAAMPKKKNYKVKEPPKKPFKKDGTLSATGSGWIRFCKLNGYPKDHKESIRYVASLDEPNPNSVPQVKEWLFSLGWEPQHFVYKRDKDTGDVRKIPQIKSERDDGTLCDSVTELAEEVPAIKLLEGMGIITHRLSFFNGILDNLEDGYVKAEIAGFTNTLRFKHKAPMANIPGVGSPWGEEIRKSFIAEDGYELCGSDMSSLEDRTKLHYMFEYDPDYVQEMSVDGFDPHLDLALQAGELTEEDLDAYKNAGDNFKHSDRYAELKSIRHTYKTTNYACVYGAGKETVARGAKCSIKDGEKLVETYWKRNWSVKKIAEDATVKTVGGQMWLFNPVSKFWYSLRYKKDIFSTLNQGTGVFAFDTWLGFILEKREQLTGQFHDEIILHVRKNNRDKCERLLREAIDKTNKVLMLNRELDVDVDFGESYAEIH